MCLFCKIERKCMFCIGRVNTDISKHTDNCMKSETQERRECAAELQIKPQNKTYKLKHRKLDMEQKSCLQHI